MRSVLHLAPADKFIPDFIDFVTGHIGAENHLFLIDGNLDKYKLKTSERVIHLQLNMTSLFVLLKAMYSSDKIILHGLFRTLIVILFFLQPWLLKKCYWIIWGADLYHCKSSVKNWKWCLKEFFRRPVIKRMGHLITYIPGDVDLAREWYGAKGKYHECFMYPSNLYQEYVIPNKKGFSRNILLGNSGDPSNNHFELLDKLLPYKDDDIKIYCPLSYGDEKHIQDVVKKGSALFGSKLIPLLEFMPFEKYLELLGQIDVVMFGHKRQQAMGNTITLLGLGKKVYMRNDVSSWDVFKNIGVKVFNVKENYFSPFNEMLRKENQLKIAGFFSKDLLVKQWQEIFNG